MGNPLDDAVDKIQALQTDYDRLTKELPPLEAKVGVVRRQVEDVNRQVVDAEAQLEQVKEDVAQRVASYNTWQNQELRKLHKIATTLQMDKALFATTIADHEAAVVVAESDLVAKEARADSRIALKRQSLEETLQEAAAQIDTNTAWAKKLTESESQLRDREQSLSQQEEALSERQSAITQKEAELERREADVETIKKAADQDRRQARILVTGLKERVAATDARDEALDHKDRQLKQKDKELADKTAALNDRRNVMLSHGQL